MENRNRNTDLEESRARTSIEGTMFKTKAFSRNFHKMGTLFSQQMYETNTLASSMEGMHTPAELRFDETCIDQRRGSLPFSWASLVCFMTTSQTLLCSDSAISRSHWQVFWLFSVMQRDISEFRLYRMRRICRNCVLVLFSSRSVTLHCVHVCFFGRETERYDRSNMEKVKTGCKIATWVQSCWEQITHWDFRAIL